MFLRHSPRLALFVNESPGEIEKLLPAPESSYGVYGISHSVERQNVS